MVRDRFPQVRMIESQENLGFATANNLAIRRSSGDYILLLNPDTKLKPCSLHTLLAFMRSTPNAGAAGARLLNADETLQISCYPEPSLLREFWRMFNLDTFWSFANYPMDHWDLSNPREVDVLMGACFLLRREVLDQVGLMDENFFMYSEEVDLCHRIQKSGWSLYWVPKAQVIHYGGQSTKLVAEEMFLQLYAGKIMYFRKHYSRVVVNLYKAILYSAALMRVIMTPFVMLQVRTRRQKYLTLSNYYRRLFFTLGSL